MAWFIAFLEGASTLAVEVIAIRLAIPVVGSSATLTGVTLAVILLALSAGYWRGGVLSARWDSRHTQTALGRNLLLAAGIYGVASFPLEAVLLEKALDAGLDVTLAIGLTASGLFLLPVYLASQTVPMLAELTNSEGKAGKASGRILFFSTLGSVVGGILTPVLLFPRLGVQRTTYGVCALLVIAGFAALGRSRLAISTAAGVTVLVLTAGAHLVLSTREPGFSFDSAYQSFRVVSDEDAEGRAERVLMLGGGRASGVYLDDGETSFAYVRATEEALGETHASNVLVIGAAGFTFPRDAARMPSVQRIDAVDLDPAVKRIAETEFLGQPLGAKIRFLPMSARYALHKLRQDGNHYGFAFVDAYYGKGIPPELLTVEFFSGVNASSDRTVVNVVMDGTLASTFANNLLASFRGAFHGVWVKPLIVEDQEFINVLVSNWPVAGSHPWNGRGIVYHDDRNSADRDWVRLLWRRGKS
jgi:predicted membrane-bound spermidine synthase